MKKVRALSLLVLISAGVGPFEMQDEVIVSVAGELLEGSGGVGALVEGDEGESAGLLGDAVFNEVDAGDGAEGAEELLEVLLGGVVGEVDDAEGALVPALSDPLHALLAAGLGHRHLVLAAARPGAVVHVGGELVFVGALGGPVVSRTTSSPWRVMPGSGPRPLPAQSPNRFQCLRASTAWFTRWVTTVRLMERVRFTLLPLL